MSEWISLTSRHDGFELSAYRAPHQDARRGGLVLVQEIFGVNAGVRAMAEEWAALGYEVIAPSMFDRDEPRADYEPGKRAFVHMRPICEATPWDQAVGDVQAAVEALEGPVFILGLCWGASVGWLAASRTPRVAAFSGYYGRRIIDLMAESPLCPTVLHFGELDRTIPITDAAVIAERHPQVAVHVYNADHGFLSGRGAGDQADAARLGKLRTQQLFQRNSGVRTEA